MSLKIYHRFANRDARRGRPGGPPEPVEDHRLAFSGATVSLTSAQFHPTSDGTLLELTEHGAFLDGLEQPSWREQGTSAQLDAPARELRPAAAERP